MTSCLNLMRYRHAREIPWILENPNASNMWLVPEVDALVALDGVSAVVSDFCQFGAPWRKRSRFICGGISKPNLLDFSRRCTGEHGFCSATGCKRRLLEGSMTTRRAQPYPLELCQTLARALPRKVRNAQINYSDLALAARPPSASPTPTIPHLFENFPSRGGSTLFKAWSRGAGPGPGGQRGRRRHDARGFYETRPIR